jgi:uncharacterized repeat protein (TIGR03803 family)
MDPVTFTLSSSASGGDIGALGPFNANYLSNPAPVSSSAPYMAPPTYGPDSAGNYYFLALLWAPDAMPNVASAQLTVTATQNGQSETEEAILSLLPPPLLLIHGMWSSPQVAGFSAGAGGFYDWLAKNYPHGFIFPVNYKASNSLAFSDPGTQGALLAAMSDALAAAELEGLAARTVDVVAHSMGGLVTRWFLSKNGYQGNPVLLPMPVHDLITIGTPHDGTKLCTFLDKHQNWPPVTLYGAFPELIESCNPLTCTLGNMLATFKMPIGGAVLSQEPNSDALGGLSTSNKFSAIAGTEPSPSCTELVLDALIGAFDPTATISGILGEPNDTIVAADSQDPTSPAPVQAATIPNIVHNRNLCFGTTFIDTGEAWSQAVWTQAYSWLTNTSPSSGPAQSGRQEKQAPLTAPPEPTLNLSGYTQVPSSNFTLLPATGTTLTINATTSITATSATKTITELLLFQSVADPTDQVLLYATTAPFSIPYTPTRLGTATFAATAVFSDQTYASTTVTYTLQPNGEPTALTLTNAPIANMSVGASRTIDAIAQFAGGQVYVTQAATYTTQSGTANVLGIGTEGAITANNIGTDVLNVSYGQLQATAQITVGACTYSLGPTNQIVSNAGGQVSIQLTTQTGCNWTVAGGAAWLAIANASGIGSGTIAVTASANNTGATQIAQITLAGVAATITQPATACSYVLSPNKISAPAGGESGAINVTTSCPLIASSNAPWVTVTTVDNSLVSYAVAVNYQSSKRTAALTIGTGKVPVVQAAATFTTLASLNDAGGYEPYAALIQGTDGNFYGTTFLGGTPHCFGPGGSTVGCGTVFKITPAGQLSTVYSFTGGYDSPTGGTDGAYPYAGLTLGTDGNFYGTTMGGGPNGYGMAFVMTPTGAESTLYSFCSLANCADGSSPWGGLAEGTDGNFYGTTRTGGADSGGGYGTAFKLTPHGKLQTIHVFCDITGGTDAAEPQASLVLGTNGFFYGTSSSGCGADGAGTAFEMSSGGTIKILHAFGSPGYDGANLAGFGALVQASDSAFYGTTVGGGAFDLGTIFRVTPAGAYADLYSFCQGGASLGCPDGSTPFGGLVQASDGNLYGTTSGCCNGSTPGTIFKLPPTSVPDAALKTIYTFCSGCPDGEFPYAGLVQGTDGNLYGTTNQGGTSGYGTVFKLSFGLPPFAKTVPTVGLAGSPVIVLGQGFTGASSVTFNGVAAAFTVNSTGTAISTSVPTGATSGKVEVVTPSGTFSTYVPFTVSK